MNKKGFTLIEVLGVVIILTAISLLVIPNVVNLFSNKKEDINKVNKELIISGAKMYVGDNKDEYPFEEGINYCILISDLIEQGYLDNKVMDINNHSIVDTHVVKVSLDDELNNTLKYEIVKNEFCQ